MTRAAKRTAVAMAATRIVAGHPAPGEPRPVVQCRGYVDDCCCAEAAPRQRMMRAESVENGRGRIGGSGGWRRQWRASRAAGCPVRKVATAAAMAAADAMVAGRVAASGLAVATAEADPKLHACTGRGDRWPRWGRCAVHRAEIARRRTQRPTRPSSSLAAGCMPAALRAACQTVPHRLHPGNGRPKSRRRRRAVPVPRLRTAARALASRTGPRRRRGSDQCGRPPLLFLVRGSRSIDPLGHIRWTLGKRRPSCRIQ